MDRSTVDVIILGLAMVTLLALSLVLASCDPEEDRLREQEVSRNFEVLLPVAMGPEVGSVRIHIGYIRDRRTGLCFAVDPYDWAGGIATVPCGVVEGARNASRPVVGGLKP